MYIYIDSKMTKKRLLVRKYKINDNFYYKLDNKKWKKKDIYTLTRSI